MAYSSVWPEPRYRSETIGANDFVISDDFKLPMDVDVLAVYPHAHYLGKLLEGWATLPDGSRMLPRGSGDRRRDLQEAAIRHRLEKVPGDSEAHMNLGAIELSRLDVQSAERDLRAAVHLDPNRPEAHNMPGLSLAATGHSAKAIEEYRPAVRTGPGYWSASFNLATELAKSGQVDQAVEEMGRVLAAHPADQASKRRLAEIVTLRGIRLLRDGEPDEP